MHVGTWCTCRCRYGDGRLQSVRVVLEKQRCHASWSKQCTMYVYLVLGNARVYAEVKGCNARPCKQKSLDIQHGLSIKVQVEQSTYASVIYLTLDHHVQIFRFSYRKERWSDSREIIMPGLASSSGSSGETVATLPLDLEVSNAYA